MEIRKIIGVLFITVSLITFGIFITRTEFSIQLQAWISFKYYMQFAPQVVSIMLFSSGIYLIRRYPKSNFALAIFGYSIIELIALDLLGVVSNSFGAIATILFGCCAIIAMWVAHSNSFNLKKLSWVQVLISILIGALESLVLYQLYSK